MSIGRVIKELIIPLLLYGFFSWYMIGSAVSAFKAIRKVKKEGIRASAQVTGYYQSKHKNGELTEILHHVTVSCTDPRSGMSRTFTLTTNSGKGKRYADITQTNVVFLGEQDSLPILPEELSTAGRVRYTALFGGIFCVLFCTLIIIGIIDRYVTGGVIGYFLHELLFS